MGLTVLHDEQDALYFILESIKDIIGGIASGLFTQEIVNKNNRNDNDSKHAERNRTHRTIVLTIIEVVALVFSIFLLLTAKLAIIERFTHWDNFIYLWMSLSVVLISVICTVALCMRLCKSGKGEKKE